MGLGPAIFGLCFYLSHVHLDEQMVAVTTTTNKFNIVHPPSISHGNVTEIPTLMAPSVTVSNSPSNTAPSCLSITFCTLTSQFYTLLQ